MWISKATIDLYTRQIAALEEQRDYWRTAYEKERDRVERMQDNFLQMQGVPPVSDAGVAKAAAEEEAHKKLLDGIKELTLEQVGEYSLSDDEKIELQRLGINLA